MKKLLLLLLLLLLTGCTRHITQVVAVLEFRDRYPVVPVPEIYSEWYANTEECLGKAGAFFNVNWYYATEIIYDDRPKLGIVQYPDDITIQIGARRVRIVLRHEMAHHISGPNKDIHYRDGSRAVCDGGP